MKYKLEEVIPFIKGSGDRKRKDVFFKTEKGDSVAVRMNKPKYSAFKKSIECACCGEKGDHFKLEYTEKDGNYFFNLYSTNGVMFTVDHIKPISRGGSKSGLYNLQTLCKNCNELKDDKCFSVEQLIDIKTQRENLKQIIPNITKTKFYRLVESNLLNKEPRLTKKLNGTLRMSRVNSSTGDDYLNIVVTDKVSRLIILDIKIPGKECLSFLSNMLSEVEMDFFQSPDIGKKREIKIIEVSMPYNATEEELDTILSDIEKTGWKASAYSLTNTRSTGWKDNGNTVIKNISVERWV